MIDDKKLRDLFVDEVLYHIRSARDFLNKSFESSQVSNEVFKIVKVFHTIKGSAGIMGLERFGDILHKCENFFQTISNKGFTPDSKIKSIRIIDEIEALITNFPKNFDEYLDKLETLINSNEVPDIEKEPITNTEIKEETSSIKNVNEDIIRQVRDLTEELTQIVEFSFKPNSSREKEKYKEKISELFHYIESITLLNLEEIAPKIKNIAHYTATKQNKNIKIEINFNKIGVDKNFFSIVEEALIHLVRNAVSHGIEVPDIRLKKGKEKAGIIKVNASSTGSKIKILVEDDGGGIDSGKIAKKAVEMGIISENEAKTLPETRLLEFIFTPNFSTAEKIDNISGRGVGLDIVKERIEAIGGIVRVKSSEKGTVFTLEIPVSFNILHCIVISTEKEKIGIPVYLVDKFIKINKDNFDSVSGRLIYNDKEYNIVHTGSLVQKNVGNESLAVIIRNKNTIITCENYEGEKLFTVKEVQGILKTIPHIIGFAIDDDLRPLAIINPLTIGSKNNFVPNKVNDSPSVNSKNRQYKALVADDNALIREMISDFLKSIDIKTVIAKNGKEALKIYKSQKFDLIITDIEMPEMDGISLLKEIRESDKIVPVLILSSRGEDNDITLAFKSGANGYFVKKFFSRENFIKKVKTLI